MIDEGRGRMVADRVNLSYTGILGILVEAKTGLTQELSETLIPLCPLRPLRFVLS
ncbi:hypothetical protein [Nostoc sp.]|uniref:hypothetical protein n=1 Tax=Nostoc sp. TaxID=1180 RepID=UPI002FF4F1FE